MTPDQELELDKLAAKINKLMAMTDASRGATQGEIESATARISALLFNSNLTMADIEKRTGKAPDPYLLEEIDSGEAEHGLSLDARIDLMCYLCQYNFCRCIFQDITTSTWKGDKWHRRRVRVILKVIGQRQNIDVVKWLYDYLVQSFVRLAENAYYEHPKGDRPNYATWMKAFYAGAIYNIWKRLKEQFEASQQQFETEHGDAATTSGDITPDAEPATSATTALIVIKDHELDAAEKQFFPGKLTKVKTGTFKNIRNGSAYDRGYEAAGTLSLQRPLEAPKADRIEGAH